MYVKTLQHQNPGSRVGRCDDVRCRGARPAGVSPSITAEFVEKQHACRPSGHCGRVSRAHPRIGRYTPTPWGPPIDRHAGRACSREHVGQSAAPQGGAVGASVRGRRVGAAAGSGICHRYLRLANGHRATCHAGPDLGLPIVVMLAWYHGDRGQQRITRSELAVLTLLLFLSGGVLWLYAQRSARRPPQLRP